MKKAVVVGAFKQVDGHLIGAVLEGHDYVVAALDKVNVYTLLVFDPVNLVGDDQFWGLGFSLFLAVVCAAGCAEQRQDCGRGFDDCFFHCVWVLGFIFFLQF